MKIKKVNWSGLCSAMVWCFNHHWIIQTLLAGLFRELRVKVLSPTMNTIFTKPFSGRATFQSHVLRLIIHGERTTMGLRGLCILYGCCLLKVCHFYFCFSEKTFLSLTKWMVSKGGGHVLEQHLGFADGCILWLLDSPPPIIFQLPKDSLWEYKRIQHKALQNVPRQEKWWRCNIGRQYLCYTCNVLNKEFYIL